MKIGLVFPQTEIGADPVVVREFAQSAEAAGFAPAGGAAAQKIDGE